MPTFALVPLPKDGGTPGPREADEGAAELEESEQAAGGGEEGDEDEEPGEGFSGAAEMYSKAEGVLNESLDGV